MEYNVLSVSNGFIRDVCLFPTCCTGIGCNAIQCTKCLRQEKGWGAKWICSEFQQKKWAVSSVNDLLRKIDKTGSVERKVGSGHPRSIRMQRNISRANDLICSQEDNPGTSKSPREIQNVTGISKNVRAFCHCVSSVTVVLWKKVNLTNNHLIFHNKIGVICVKITDV